MAAIGTAASARPSDPVLRPFGAGTMIVPALSTFDIRLEFPMKPVSMRVLALAAALALPLASPAVAAELSPQAKAQITSTVDRNQAALDSAALEIWKDRKCNRLISSH